MKNPILIRLARRIRAGRAAPRAYLRRPSLARPIAPGLRLATGPVSASRAGEAPPLPPSRRWGVDPGGPSAYGSTHRLAPEADIAAKGIKFFDEIDQGQLPPDAKNRPAASKLLLFGNPPWASSSYLQPLCGPGLAVRIAVVQDADGKVWVAYSDFAWIAQRYGSMIATRLQDGLGRAASSPPAPRPQPGRTTAEPQRGACCAQAPDTAGGHLVSIMARSFA